MTRRWRDRRRLWSAGSAIVSASLVLMVMISAAAAWTARTSWLEHQRAVDQALSQYAGYAARNFYENVATEVQLVRLRAMAAVTGATAYPDDRLTLDRFSAAVSQAMDPHLAYDRDPMRGVFRIDPVTSAYRALHAAAQPGVARAIRAHIASRRAALDTASQPLSATIDSDDGRVSLYFAMQRTSSGHAVAIYGMTVSWRESFGRLMDIALPRMRLLPPSVHGHSAALTPVPRSDTLVSIRMLLPDGSTYYETPVQHASSAMGVFTGFSMPPQEIRATLHPQLAARLRGEMLDENRRRLQFALAILTALFALAAILHIRRERELVRARRDFVASVSHELRTPLAQIRMFSETLLLGREESDAERQRWLGIIAREARRLGDLVENILLFSHIDAARVRLEPERTDLGELVEEVVEAYVPIAEARRMRIVADAPSRIFAVVDPRALRQVVVNLIDNALKYGPAGQTVTVEVERNATTAQLSVSDQGAGVPAQDRARLWQPFVRLADGGTAGGSGIGLSVVRSLVQQHGGSVAVEDAEGGGARFIVRLPLSDGRHPGPGSGRGT